MENVSMIGKEDDQIELPPGFRFHPTDEELISHYLHKKVMDVNFSAEAIGEADLNKSEPWELPWQAKMGEKEWYFFCLKDRKYPTGLRTNRATEAGYWKATGKDKEIFRGKSLVGMKKTLVFYRGRAPKGGKTNWVMHEYRLDGKLSRHSLPETAKNEWVISRVFEKTLAAEKTHISSGLAGVGSEAGFALPPLMDSSSTQTTNAEPVVEPVHVPCFSNPIFSAAAQRNKEQSPLFSTSFSIPRVPILGVGSLHSADPLSFPPSLQFPGPVLMPEHSVLRSLLQNPSLKTEAQIITGTQETWQTRAVNNPGISPAVSSAMYHDHHHLQQAPSTSASGPADLDFMWNY